ncbi:hypothetical protein V2J09_016647, partial [Rumex salicifolius]
IFRSSSRAYLISTTQRYSIYPEVKVSGLVNDDVAELQQQLLEEAAARQRAEQAFSEATNVQSTTTSALAAVLVELAAMRQTLATVTDSAPPQASTQVPSPPQLVTNAVVSAQQQHIAPSSRVQRDNGKVLASTSTALPRTHLQRLPSIIESARDNMFHDRYKPTRSPHANAYDDGQSADHAIAHDNAGNVYPNTLSRQHRYDRFVTNQPLSSQRTRPTRPHLGRTPSPVHFGEYDEEDMDLAGVINPGNYHPPLHDPIENMNVPEGWIPGEIHDLQGTRRAPRRT